MPESHRVSIRVHTPLLEWIERQALDGESPSKVVQRLIVELAASEGVVLDSVGKTSVAVNVKVIEKRVNEIEDEVSQITSYTNERFTSLEAVMAAFDDSLKRLKRDVASINL